MKRQTKLPTLTGLDVPGPTPDVIGCNKVNYGSRASACAAQPHQNAYHCALCSAWHTTTARRMR